MFQEQLVSRLKLDKSSRALNSFSVLQFDLIRRTKRGNKSLLTRSTYPIHNWPGRFLLSIILPESSIQSRYILLGKCQGEWKPVSFDRGTVHAAIEIGWKFDWEEIRLFSTIDRIGRIFNIKFREIDSRTSLFRPIKIAKKKKSKKRIGRSSFSFLEYRYRRADR